MEDQITYGNTVLYKCKDSNKQPLPYHFVKWVFEKFQMSSFIDYNGNLGEISLEAASRGIDCYSVWSNPNELEAFALTVIGQLKLNIAIKSFDKFIFPTSGNPLVHIHDSEPTMFDWKSIGYPRVLFCGDHKSYFETRGYNVMKVEGTNYLFANQNVNNLLQSDTINGKLELFDYYNLKGKAAELIELGKNLLKDLDDEEQITMVLYRMCHGALKLNNFEYCKSLLDRLSQRNPAPQYRIGLTKLKGILGYQLQDVEKACLQLENNQYDQAYDSLLGLNSDAFVLSLLATLGTKKDDYKFKANRAASMLTFNKDYHKQDRDYGLRISGEVSYKIKGTRHQLKSKLTNEYFNECNPSIVRHKNQWYVILRTVNYTQKGAREWNINHSKFNGVVWTKNYLLILNDSLEIRKEYLIIDPPIVANPPHYNRPIRGMEDMRLFVRDNKLMATFTLLNTHNQSEKIFSRIGEVEFQCPDDNKQSVEVRFIREHGTLNSKPQEVEKNWLPFEDGYVYWYDPMTILDRNGQNAIIKDSNFDLSTFRGSAGPIQYNGGWLLVVHQVIMSAGSRIYYHRFLYLNCDFEVKNISESFHFDHIGVEFCCGLATNGKDLYLTYGIEDYTAELLILNKDNLEDMWLLSDAE